MLLNVLDQIAQEIAALPRQALVAIDGVDGAGKTTFAGRLAAQLPGRTVTRMCVDDYLNPPEVRYARGRHSPEGFYRDSHDLGRLRRELDAFRGDLLLFDGIFAHRPELRGCWTYSVFLRVSEATANARCLARDGSRGPRYVEGQRLYLAECEPARRATRVIDND